MANAPTTAEKKKVFKTIPSVKAYEARLIELINQDPGSEAGLKVVDWWYRRGGRRQRPELIARLIMEHYSKLESIEKYVPRVAWQLPKKEAQKHLKLLIDSNPFDAVKACATYELHELLRKQAKKLESDATETIQAELKTLRDSIFNSCADATDSRGAKYVELLEAVAFASKLEIGEPVPDIIGPDIDGVEFKLSDYDRKVRVISFWGNW